MIQPEGFLNVLVLLIGTISSPNAPQPNGWGVQTPNRLHSRKSLIYKGFLHHNRSVV